MAGKHLKTFLYFVAEGALMYLGLLLLTAFFMGGVVYADTGRLLPMAFITVLASHLYQGRRGYFMAWGIFYCLLCSVWLPYTLLGEHLMVKPMAKYMAAVGCIACLVIMLVTFFASKALRKILFVLCAVPLLLIAAAFLGYYFSTNAAFGDDSILAIMQTNPEEAKEYLADYFSIRGGISALLVFLTGWGIWRRVRRLELRRGNKYCLPLMLALSVGCLWVCHAGRNNDVFNIFTNAGSNLERYADFQRKQAERRSLAQGSLQLESNSQGVYVLVIGESQNKDYMSAYGYDKKTTPWLDKAVQEKSFIKFTRAYSCHTYTVPVLTYALTAKNQYNDLPLESAVSIVEAAEAAGYQTAWLSNQVRYSAWDTPVSVIASGAGQQIWLNHNIGEKTETNVYDASLADKIDTLQISDKMLIVIHLMGNHSSYDERYPAEFAAFNTGNTHREKTIDKYDNSILYNDYVVSKIYEQVRQLPGFKCMVYFSDHADAVREGLGHDASRFSWSMTHIPLYIALSDDFMQEEAGLTDRLRAASDKVFTNDLIFNLLSGVMGIKIPSLYEPENDITSASYNYDIQRFRSLYNEKMVKDDVK